MQCINKLYLLVICEGNSPVPGEGQWRGASMVSLIRTRINGWVNNGEAGDLRRHRTHYDVTVMIIKIRRSHDRFIFNMGIPYLGKTVIILGPGYDGSTTYDRQSYGLYKLVPNLGPNSKGTLS